MTWCAHGGISKIFFLDHFTPSFLGQKILTGQTKVEFVIYWVLRQVQVGVDHKDLSLSQEITLKM